MIKMKYKKIGENYIGYIEVTESTKCPYYKPYKIWSKIKRLNKSDALFDAANMEKKIKEINAL